ncbi:putative mitochondrial intermediate peptidase, mitochondrial [Morella rubra]|uniref:Putative mitochondrial intermediate peptidase, mitochondrial n=1 Tax=Morella rubra TaxID=262757 RepID=A0A6A1VAJ1_9ROSI|nr:putative mitochondrial intermediate peptidase, mitochondrial [Morella rubra]KAB1208181.1 putative mitochondrial intermediate peptidase, mitochondrial [Morella rubra]KAB1210835.1 putative mitochondrial intermediate peptidase, mitochondrial [Morella rubra]
MRHLIRRTAQTLRLYRFLGSRNANPLRSQLYYTSVVASQTGASSGLYGFDHLKCPKGFQRFVDDAIERSGELVAYISGLPSSAEIIRAMDEISDTVCSVVDSAELCRHTHPDREFIEEANKASMRINEYLHYLNTNHSLYDAIRKAEQEKHLLTEEAQRAAHYLRVDFERGGIHLSADKLDRVNQLNIEIAQLCREFNENIIVDPGSVDIFPSSRIPKSLHHLLKPSYHSSSVSTKAPLLHRDTRKEKGFRITTDPHSVSSVLQLAADDEVRKMVYVQGNSVPHANLGILDKLIAARHELAQIMGSRSYAEFAVKPNMASSPAVVMSFLNEISKMIRPRADEEFKKIRDFKIEKCGIKCGDLEPWDEAYYTSLMKSSTYDLDSAVVASYFPLPQCIEGLKVLVESLFGATFRSIPLASGESWHEDVLKLSLHHPEEGDLGYLYLDLYSRKGKYPGCAHFAIKGGRRISETEYQLPVVALVCNFSGSCNPSSVRLNHWELETLFHEFGHALHSLLSRTDYQHFSGTRVVLDLAETPSNLFEYFAWDYRVLKTFARHYSTGEIIPEKLVESMQGARKMFAATELQRQIFYASIDQTLFAEQPSLPRDTSSIVADLKNQYTSWKHVEGTHWQTRFSHLLNYGAGYYSYLYAKCFAATIWQKLCQEDPLSLTTGTALRTRLLQHGGAREPACLLKDLIGEGMLRNCDGGIVPDLTSLCDEMKLGEAF